MDGRSWLPLINGQKQDGRDYVITHVNTVSSGMSLPQRCIRTKDWALLFHSWVDGKAKFKVEAMSGITYNAMAKAAGSDEKIAGRVKQLRVGEPLMFFNEHTDTAERSNAVNDANYKTEIERLAGLLLDHMKKTEDPEAANFTKALDDWRKAAK
jgi:N-sulfoglucosamine sulfohydrolase